jgi:hypothetical protein
MNDFYSQQWLNHCYDGFPRKIGFVKDPSPRPKKEMVDTPDEFLREVWIHVAHVDLFVAVFNEWQKQTQRFNKIYIDLDAEDPKDAYKELQEIVSFVAPSRVYFSGAKGFHIFYDFPECKFEHYYDSARKWVKHMELALSLETIDYSVVGEVERVSRLPFTKHTGTNQLCIPVNPTWPFEAILQRSRFGCAHEKWLFIEPQFDQSLGDVLSTIDMNWQPPTPLVPLEIDTHGMDEDLAYIIKHAYKFLGVKRIIYAKILPIMKQRNAAINEVLVYCENLCFHAKRSWDAELQQWIRAAYKSESGIPWSWAAIFHKWPEIRGWFK